MKRICLLLSLLALLGGAGDLRACTTAIVSAEASANGRPMIWKQRDASNIYNCLRHVSGPRYDGHFRREGFDPEWLRRYNAEADARFLLFKTSVAE